MKSSRFVPVAIVLTILLALSAGLSTAQGPVPQGAGQPQAQLGSAFTYQGFLQKDGSPINATCEIAFSLYDDPNDGYLWGDPITKTVTVADGLFTVLLDYPPYWFTGIAFWLEIAVRCSPDPGFHTLTPRQALTPTPYAYSLRPGAVIAGAAEDVAVLWAFNTATGSASYGVLGQTASNGGASGVYGYASATSGESYGVYGRTNSDSGIAVYGYADSTSGSTYGVYGRTDSPSGCGVYGYAVAGSGYTNGVVGTSDSISGNGIAGYANAASGLAWGVYGQSNSTEGTAVRGHAIAASGLAWGVYGQSNSTEGTAVRGHAIAASGATYGVYGRVDSSAGVAVYGYNSSASSGIAVYGLGPNAVVGDSSTPNYGAVVGRNLATTGTGSGVYGSSASTVGRGVYGYASATSGVPVGVVGETESPDGFGVYAWGDLGASGTKSAVVQTPGYGYRRLYALESPEVLFEDVGTAQLVNGRAVVSIDPVFAQTVNLEQPYQVFLTPQGGYCALYVAEKTTASFTVRAQEGSSCQIAFDYRIIAKRLGYEDVRLEPTQLPPRAPNEPPGPVISQEQP